MWMKLRNLAVLEQKRRMNEDIDSIVKSAYDLFEKAESTGGIYLIWHNQILVETSKENAKN